MVSLERPRRRRKPDTLNKVPNQITRHRIVSKKIKSIVLKQMKIMIVSVAKIMTI